MLHSSGNVGETSISAREHGAVSIVALSEKAADYSYTKPLEILGKTLDSRDRQKNSDTECTCWGHRNCPTLLGKRWENKRFRPRRRDRERGSQKTQIKEFSVKGSTKLTAGHVI